MQAPAQMDCPIQTSKVAVKNVLNVSTAGSSLHLLLECWVGKGQGFSEPSGDGTTLQDWWLSRSKIPLPCSSNLLSCDDAGNLVQIKHQFHEGEQSVQSVSLETWRTWHLGTGFLDLGSSDCFLSHAGYGKQVAWRTTPFSSWLFSHYVLRVTKDLIMEFHCLSDGLEYCFSPHWLFPLLAHTSQGYWRVGL